MAQGVAISTKPAGVRVVNLTGSTVSVKVGNLTRYELSSEEITPCLLVGPKKPAPVELTFAGTATTEKVDVTESKFSTLVIKGKGNYSRFTSGSVLSNPSKAVIDFMNLTDSEVTFQASGESITVKPNDSVHKEFDFGSIGIKASGASADLSVGANEVVAVYALNSGGKTIIKTRSLKGTGAPVATGGPSAS